MSGPLEVLVPADIRFPLERANGVQIIKTAHALARAGARTTLVVRQSDPRPSAEILLLYGLAEHPNLSVLRLPVMHRQGSFTVPRLSFMARATAACAAGLRRGAVVFTRDLQLADVLLKLVRVVSGPLVYEAHAVEALMYGERGTLYGTTEAPREVKTRRLERREGRVWKLATGFVSTTAGIRDSFRETHGNRVGPACVVPNGCDVPEPRSFDGLPADEPPRVLYAGQLYPWKGVDVLVEAIAAVPGARLVIVGGLEGEADLIRVRELVRRHGLEGRTEMAGTVPQAQVAREMARARVVVVPFLKSGMTERHTSPIKAFEAMAAGRPIVISDLPSSREFMRDEENALLVPPGDAPALAAGINRLLGDGALAQRLARTAWDEAPRYSWDARARSLCTLMESIR